MALTMLRAKQFAMSLALVVFASGAGVSAQINPATAKSAAQNGAQTANKSAAQSSATASNSTKQAATTTTKPQSQPPAAQKTAPKTPAQTTTTSTAPKPQSQTKPPATQPKAPATQVKAPATQTKPVVPPKAQQPPAQAAKKPATPDKKPVTDKKATNDKKPAMPAPATKTAPAQKTPPASPTKPGAEVTKTTKPAPVQGRRDPFIGLVGKQSGGSGPALRLPPGKGGLQVSTIILQGIVSGPNGMIAVVANPQKSVYFLRVGDELFDGRVEKIEIGSVTFHEVGKDAFGKPLEREVTKKLNPSSGDLP